MAQRPFTAAATPGCCPLCATVSHFGDTPHCLCQLWAQGQPSPLSLPSSSSPPQPLRVQPGTGTARVSAGTGTARDPLGRDPHPVPAAEMGREWRWRRDKEMEMGQRMARACGGGKNSGWAWNGLEWRWDEEDDKDGDEDGGGARPGLGMELGMRVGVDGAGRAPGQGSVGTIVQREYPDDVP